MSLTHQDLRAVAYLVNRARPSWELPGIMAALDKIRDRDLVAVTVAAMRATARDDQHTPAVIAMSGPHWSGDPVNEPTHVPDRYRPGEFAPVDPVVGDRRAELIAQARAGIRTGHPPLDPEPAP